VPKLSVSLSPDAEKRLRARIAAMAGKKLREIVYSLHARILENTPLNTGRTLGSWAASADTALLIDIADTLGRDEFIYTPMNPETNNRPVGSEPGRSQFVQMSLNTSKKIDFERNPYRIFFVSNGARLDSGFMEWPNGFVSESLPSGLPQTAGSRAYAQEYGLVAGFDVYAKSTGLMTFPFNARGTLAVHMAVESIRLTYGKF
jgi:hypothetical protein